MGSIIQPVVAIVKMIRPNAVPIDGKKINTSEERGMLIGGKSNPARVKVRPAAIMMGQKLDEGR